MVKFKSDVPNRFSDKDVVLVEWYDHFGNEHMQNWRSEVEIQTATKHPMIVRTAGFALIEDKDSITLASNERGDVDDTESAYSQTTTIRKALVTHIWRLKAGK